VKGLRAKKGLEKSLWVKKFIHNIFYSKGKVTVNLNCFKDVPSRAQSLSIPQNQPLKTEKEEGQKPSSFPQMPFEAFKMAPDVRFIRTIEIILPNTIHGCKKKNI
jgi:hypothetical protein